LSVSIRYIIVNFNAWTYAGSDTLWAGIATNLSEAIETEFGMLTARLFRLFDIECVPNNTTENIQINKFYASLGDWSPVVEEILHGFGQLMSSKRFYDGHWRPATESSNSLFEVSDWWLLEYATVLEAASASDYLKKQGVSVQYSDPVPEHTQQRIQKVNSQEEKHALLDHISNNRCELSDSNSSYQGACFLLKKYPKTSCGLPLLLWTTVFLFILAIPIPLSVYASLVS